MRTLLKILAAFIFYVATFTTSAAELREVFSKEKRELEWRLGDQKLAVICFGTNLFKPYVRELYSLDGDNVLRDSPADHFHHHGLMYAIHINGFNFWEEKEEPPGLEKTVQQIRHKILKNKNQTPTAECALLIHWLMPTNKVNAESAKQPLLIEQRTITLTTDEKNREVALRWRSAFEVGPQKVKLHGTDYNGLGMRLPESFDRVAVFQNSDNAPYPGVRGKPTRNSVAAKWSSVSGKVGQHDIAVTIFHAPENQSGNHFFSMLEPFTYSAATQALDQNTLEYAPGEKYELNFLVTVHAGIRSAEFLNQRFQQWQQTAARQ